MVVVDGAAAVLDGATSWLRDPDDPRDGGWYSRVLGSALTARLPAAGASLTEVLADAIAAVRDAHALTPGDSPYSTASIVRWTGDRIDVLVLGDSPAVVRPVTGSVAVVADPRLSTTAAAERTAYRQHLAGGAGFDDRFGQLMAAVQRAERAAFNRTAVSGSPRPSRPPPTTQSRVRGRPNTSMRSRCSPTAHRPRSPTTTSSAGPASSAS